MIILFEIPFYSTTYVSAANDANDYTYTINDDGSAYITSYKGKGGDITVPLSIDGHLVSGLSHETFWENNLITSAVVEARLTSSPCFYGCDNLISVTLSDGIEKITNYDFDYCFKLERLIIPDSVNSIELYPFSGCDNLVIYCSMDSYAEVYAMDNKISCKVPNGQIVDCTEMVDGDYKYILRSNGTAWITNYSGNDDIIHIPSYLGEVPVTSIGESSFSEKAIKEVIMPNAISNISRVAFEDCRELKLISFSNSLRRIGEYAFDSCYSIKEIKLPDGVESFEEGVFRYCHNLEKAILPQTMPYISGSFFEGCWNLSRIDIPNTVKRIDGLAFDNTALKEVVIPEGCEQISTLAFNNCEELEKVIIPKSMMYIGTSVFKDCILLKIVQVYSKNIKWEDSISLTYRKHGNFEDACEDLVLRCYENSTTADYAEKWNLKTEFFDEKDKLVISCPTETKIATETKNKISAELMASNEQEVTALIRNLAVSSNNESVCKASLGGCFKDLTVPTHAYFEIELTGINPGETDIIVSTGDNISVKCHVIVTEFQIKMYSEIPTMVLGKGRNIGAAVQLDKNGEVVTEGVSFSIVSSDSNIVSVGNIRDETDGTFFNINAINEGETVITVTENLSGIVFSTLVQVNSGIVTFNAEAMPEFYDKKNKYNVYVDGMYIDDFSDSSSGGGGGRSGSNLKRITFNVYNTLSSYGVVDVYDAEGKLIKSELIDRFSDGYATSIKDTCINGFKVVEDIFSGDAFTYKQDSYSEETPIEIDVPVGGRIEITNNSTYSDTCAIYNFTNFLTTSILLFGDVANLKSSQTKEIASKTSKNVVKRFLEGYADSFEGGTTVDKIVKIGSKFAEELDKKAGKEILESGLKTNIASLIEEGTLIFEECDIDLSKIILECSADIGISIAESSLRKAMGLPGMALTSLFTLNKFLDYSAFYIDMIKSSSNKTLVIYFDNENGCLCENGVSVKAENGTEELSKNNYVIRSVALSNDQDLTGQIKDALDKVSKQYVVRDIYMLKDGIITQPNTLVQVTIPIPKEYNLNKCKLYWILDNGSLTEIAAEIDNGNFVFTTEHFSYYAVVEENDRNDNVEELCAHQYVWVTDKFPTQTEEGRKHLECLLCSDKIAFVKIPKIAVANNDDKNISDLGTIYLDAASGAIYKITKDDINIRTASYLKTKVISGTLAVPDSIQFKGKIFNVTEIGNGAASNNTQITKVIMGKNVTSVGQEAFSRCSKLKTVTIGKSVTFIGKNAFFGCSQLKTVAIGKNVTSIKSKAFSQCVSLKQAVIPSKVKNIGSKAFYGCSSLKKLTIKTTKLIGKSIGSKAFSGVSKKVTVKVPKSKLKSYKKLLKKKGIGKKAKIK